MPAITEPERDASAIKNTCRAWRRPECSSQHSHGRSQSLETQIPGNYVFYGLQESGKYVVHIRACGQNTYVNKIIINKYF